MEAPDLHAVREAGATGLAMKAMIQDRYGAFELLTMRDVPKPVIGDEEVLVRVHAAGLHVADCFAAKGSPYLMRMSTGLSKPKYGVPGFDLAGRVEAVGSKVTRFQPGDEVFGACEGGACAEFVSTKEAWLAPKPERLTFEQAAAIPTSALAALHGLRDAGKVQPGHTVLINGASGGVGTFAIQLAKWFGAEVTAVCSTGSMELVRSIGADHVVDYTREDFTLSTQRYDLILDNVENRSLSECRRVLAPDGTLLLNSGTGAQGFAFMVRLFKPLVVSPFVRQNLRRFFSMPNQEDLAVLKDLVDAGTVSPVIDRTYPLSEVANALRHIDGGHAHGKIVVTLDA